MHRLHRGMSWAATLLALGACEPVSDVLGGSRTPHEAYAESLRQAGLADRALGASWLAAADRALEQPLPVTLPFRETGFFRSGEADAHGYRIAVRRGERLMISLETELEAPTRVFVDLFESEPGTPLYEWDHLASADSVATEISYRVDSDAVHVLRVQPELLRSARYTLTIQVQPTLGFPVEGHDADDIRSAFGADRDGGRRVHHGVDIFAPRGTPVLAAGRGRVEARLNRLGGKVVWQRVPELGSIYYAHLDSQAVTSGTLAMPGDTIGFVGNTGNAVTTPPHLHFGIYMRPGGPVDPYPFIHQPVTVPLDPLPPSVALGGEIRTLPSTAVLWDRADAAADPVDSLPAGTVGTLIAGAGDWRRIILPDGRTGFLRTGELAGTDPGNPLRSTELPAPATLRLRPDSTSLAIAEIPAGAGVSVLGRFGVWQLVVLDERAGGASDRTARLPDRGWLLLD